VSPQDLKRKQTKINQFRQEIGIAEKEKRTIGIQRTSVKAQVNDFNNQINDLDRSISAAFTEIRKIEESLKKSTRKEVIVSEHAILRFIERVIGVDLEEIQEKILPPGNSEAVMSFGDGTFPVDDHIIQVRNGVIVTVLNKKGDKY